MKDIAPNWYAGLCVVSHILRAFAGQAHFDMNITSPLRPFPYCRIFHVHTIGGFSHQPPYTPFLSLTPQHMCYLHPFSPRSLPWNFNSLIYLFIRFFLSSALMVPLGLQAPTFLCLLRTDFSVLWKCQGYKAYLPFL